MNTTAMDRRTFFARLGAAAWMLNMRGLAQTASRHAGKPNVVYILADDLGWGDMDVYNAHSAIPTPHCNAFASQGMRFHRHARVKCGVHAEPVQHSNGALQLAIAAEEGSAERRVAGFD